MWKWESRTWITLVTKLSALPYYKSLFQKAYGDETVTVARISFAVSAFMECIVTKNTRLDKIQAAHRHTDCSGNGRRATVPQ